MTPFALIVFEAVVTALPFLGGVAQSFGWMDVGLGDGLLVGLGLGGTKLTAVVVYSCI